MLKLGKRRVSSGMRDMEMAPCLRKIGERLLRRRSLAGIGVALRPGAMAVGELHFWRRSSSDTLNIWRGLRFMKLATKTSGIWAMRVL
jgi:hypothetical protein